jgi:hypothetical protein
MIFSIIIKSLIGRKIWLKNKYKHNIGNEGIYMIVMPDDDQSLNEIVLQHIDDFLNYRKGKGAVILTADTWTKNNYYRFSRNILSTELLSQHELLYLLCYHRYYRFSDYFVLMSLQDSYGKRLAHAEKFHGITKVEMVCIGLYNIRDWTKSRFLNEHL